MTLNDNNKITRASHIECKSHNPTSDSIAKDIEKLCGEQNVNPTLDCHAWFHLLKNQDSGTLTSLFEKFKDGFLKKKITPVPIKILFVIYGYDKKIYWKGWFECSNIASWVNYVIEFFETKGGDPAHSSWKKNTLERRIRYTIYDSKT